MSAVAARDVAARVGAVWLLAALSLVLILAAAVSLDAAFDVPTAAWLLPSAVPAAAGLAGAAVVRSLGARMLAPLLAGLVVAGCAWCLQWWPDTLWLGVIPTPATLGAALDFTGQLREVIWTDTVPVTPSDPVLAGVGAVLGVTALLTDAIAVGLRSPAIAGIPALVLLGGAGLITAGVAPWPALAVAAAAWLGLLAVGTDAVLSLVHRSRAPGRELRATARPDGAERPETIGRPDTSERPAGTVMTGPLVAGTLLTGAAALTVLVLAALQAPLLTSGLAPEGQRLVLGQGAGPVDPAADLGRELRSDTGYAGISYQTEDGRGVYLRTAVVEDVYASPWDTVPPGSGPSESGPPEAQRPATTDGFVPAGVRLAGGTEQLAALAQAGIEGPGSTVRVSLEDWSGNWAPLPDQVWSVDEALAEHGWRADGSTSVAYRDQATPVDLTYRAAVVPLQLSLQELASLTSAGAPQWIYDRWGAAEELQGSAIDALADEVTSGLVNPVEQAAAIQQYLTSGRFSYSETAPVDQGYDGSGIQMTEQFLAAGAGYCIHYASAMTMMSQAVGIPARVVVGYAPVGASGASGTEHRVTSDRAHSWPELYLDGVGWVPFEPTPGVGRTPVYSQAEDSDAAAPAEDPALAPGQVPSPQAPSTGPDASGDGPGADAADGGTAVGRIAGRVSLGVGAAALLAGLAVLPRWLRSRRRRARLGAHTGVKRWAEIKTQNGAQGGTESGARGGTEREVQGGPECGPVKVTEDGSGRLRRDVGEAWRELEDTAVDLGRARRPHESEPVFARRLLADDSASDETEAIANAITWARYAPDGAPAPAKATVTPERVGSLIAGLELAADPAVRRRARWLPASLLPEWKPLAGLGRRSDHQ